MSEHDTLFSGITTFTTVGTPLKVEYYTLKGERIANPGSGLYMIRMTMPDGTVVSRKVVK